ncbi:substrate-binding periplasmic protein, partial [Pseudomonas aeruginosa]
MGASTWHWPGLLLGLLLPTAGAPTATQSVANPDCSPKGCRELRGKGLAPRILREALSLVVHREQMTC